MQQRTVQIKTVKGDVLNVIMTGWWDLRSLGEGFVPNIGYPLTDGKVTHSPLRDGDVILTPLEEPKSVTDF
jgi:hypothetical protein